MKPSVIRRISRRCVPRSRRLSRRASSRPDSPSRGPSSRRSRKPPPPALRRLPNWSGSHRRTRAARGPVARDDHAVRVGIQSAEAAVRDLDAELSKEDKAIRGIETRIREQALQQEVPTEDDLRQARRRRDAGWSLIRRSWLDHHEDPAATGRLHRRARAGQHAGGSLRKGGRRRRLSGRPSPPRGGTRDPQSRVAHPAPAAP